MSTHQTQNISPSPDTITNKYTIEDGPSDSQWTCTVLGFATHAVPLSQENTRRLSDDGRWIVSVLPNSVECGVYNSDTKKWSVLPLPDTDTDDVNDPVRRAYYAATINGGGTHIAVSYYKFRHSDANNAFQTLTQNGDTTTIENCTMHIGIYELLDDATWTRLPLTGLSTVVDAHDSVVSNEITTHGLKLTRRSSTEGDVEYHTWNVMMGHTIRLSNESVDDANVATEHVARWVLVAGCTQIRALTNASGSQGATNGQVLTFTLTRDGNSSSSVVVTYNADHRLLGKTHAAMGYTLALHGTGQTLAVSSVRHTASPDDTPRHVGIIQVYQWNDTDGWSPHGNAVDGGDSDGIFHTYTGEGDDTTVYGAGRSIALHPSDPNQLLITTWIPMTSQSRVRMYTYTEEGGKWETKWIVDSTSDEQFVAVSLSEDNKIAVATVVSTPTPRSYQVRVYHPVVTDDDTTVSTYRHAVTIIPDDPTIQSNPRICTQLSGDGNTLLYGLVSTAFLRKLVTFHTLETYHAAASSPLVTLMYVTGGDPLVRRIDDAATIYRVREPVHKPIVVQLPIDQLTGEGMSSGFLPPPGSSSDAAADAVSTMIALYEARILSYAQQHPPGWYELPLTDNVHVYPHGTVVHLFITAE